MSPPMNAPPDGPVLRLLDASANRAREALRVMEDYARFIASDGPLAGSIKGLRHELAAALGPLLGDAILHRDTPGDVGVANKTPGELSRADSAAVAVAAGKRLSEALRSIEEFAKTISPADAAAVESLRYRGYELERQLVQRCDPNRRFAGVRLYVLVTERHCRGDWLHAAEAALAGGADCLQLREKEQESGELLRRAKLLVALCRRYDAVSIINDRADIAFLAGADGVHVGQQDLPPREARRIVGPGKIVGVSTHAIEQARQAVADGADYIGVGSVFRSATKPREILPGLEYARQIAAEIPIPAIAIAGITLQNVDEVLKTGVRSIAVCAAVMEQDDIAAAARAMKERLIDPTSAQ
ncbi:MAG TPA: thiamine phosphate synthase [Tepidisphaeraceae bacterium]|nr:thiamine phosphate synthase [Tepidisphaeraceae bacterium]